MAKTIEKPISVLGLLHRTAFFGHHKRLWIIQRMELSGFTPPPENLPTVGTFILELSPTSQRGKRGKQQVEFKRVDITFKGMRGLYKDDQNNLLICFKGTRLRIVIPPTLEHEEFSFDD